MISHVWTDMTNVCPQQLKSFDCWTICFPVSLHFNINHATNRHWFILWYHSWQWNCSRSITNRRGKASQDTSHFSPSSHHLLTVLCFFTSIFLSFTSFSLFLVCFSLSPFAPSPPFSLFQVRALEQQNKLLETKWQLLQGQTHSESRLEPMMKTYISSLQVQVDNLRRDKERLDADLHSVHLLVHENKQRSGSWNKKVWSINPEQRV